MQMLAAGIVDAAAIDCTVWDDVASEHPGLVAALHIVPPSHGGMSHMRFPTQVRSHWPGPVMRVGLVTESGSGGRGEGGAERVACSTRAHPTPTL